MLSGGLDSNALQKPKRFFGAARNIEEGGSLTIGDGARRHRLAHGRHHLRRVRGTGNMEIHLDRKLVDKRVFLPSTFQKSGTRKEELLIRARINRIWVLRKVLNPLSGVEAMELLLDKLGKNAVERRLPRVDAEDGIGRLDDHDSFDLVSW